MISTHNVKYCYTSSQEAYQRLRVLFQILQSVCYKICSNLKTFQLIRGIIHQ